MKADSTVVISGKSLRRDSAIYKAEDNNIVDIAYGNKRYGSIYLLTDYGKVITSRDNYSDVDRWKDIVAISDGIEGWIDIFAVTNGGKIRATEFESNEILAEALEWNNIAYVARDGNTIVAITLDGYVKVSSNEKSPYELNNLRLFYSYLTLEEDRLQQIEDRLQQIRIAEEKRFQGIMDKIAKLERELSEVKGLFAGSKKKKLQNQIDELRKSI